MKIVVDVSDELSRYIEFLPESIISEVLSKHLEDMIKSKFYKTENTTSSIDLSALAKLLTLSNMTIPVEAVENNDEDDTTVESSNVYTMTKITGVDSEFEDFDDDLFEMMK